MQKHRHFPAILLVILFGWGVASTTHASSIVVANPSFEDSLATSESPANNWVNINSSGTYVPGATQYAAGVVPDGTTVGYTNASPGLYQVLTTNEAANTIYTLTVEIGKRSDEGANNPNYTIQLLAGTTVATSTVLASAVNPVTPTVGASSLATLTYTSPAVVLPGQAIQIRFVGNQDFPQQANYDSVALDGSAAPGAVTAVPLPSSALAGVGLLVVIAGCRKIRSAPHHGLS